MSLYDILSIPIALIWMTAFIFLLFGLIWPKKALFFTKVKSRLVVILAFSGLVMLATILTIAISNLPEAKEREQKRAALEQEKILQAAEVAQVQQLAEEKKKEEGLAACKQDIVCWGDRHLLKATLLCKKQIERQAKYSFKWTDGIMEGKFKSYVWQNKEKGLIAYYGDKIQFQDGFGVWGNVAYTCVFDTNFEVVDSLKIRGGAL